MSPTRIVSIVIVLLAMLGVMVIGSKGGDYVKKDAAVPAAGNGELAAAPAQAAKPAAPPSDPNALPDDSVADDSEGSDAWGSGAQGPITPELSPEVSDGQAAPVAQAPGDDAGPDPNAE